MDLWRNGWCLCGQHCAGSRCQKKKRASTVMANRGAIAKINSNGTGILIHRALVLTTHGTLPSVSAAEGSSILVSASANGADSIECRKRLAPERFFITNSALDLTVVACDPIEIDVVQPLCLQNFVSPVLDFGRLVYLLGHQQTREAEKEDLILGEGKVTVGTDTLIKISTDLITWRPGSAGFDINGNLAFMICDPMKLVSSSSQKKKVSATTFWKKDAPKQFGIPVPEILHWLSQHWGGNIEELSKARVPSRLKIASKNRVLESSGSSTSYKNGYKEYEHSHKSSIDSDIQRSVKEEIKEEEEEVSSAPANYESARVVRNKAYSLSPPAKCSALENQEGGLQSLKRGQLKTELVDKSSGSHQNSRLFKEDAEERRQGPRKSPPSYPKSPPQQNECQEGLASQPGGSFQHLFSEKKNSHISEKCLLKLMSEEAPTSHSPEIQKEKLQLLDKNFPAKLDKPNEQNSGLQSVKLEKPNNSSGSYDPEKKQPRESDVQRCDKNKAILHDNSYSEIEKCSIPSAILSPSSRLHTGSDREEVQHLRRSPKVQKEALEFRSPKAKSPESANKAEEKCSSLRHGCPKSAVSPEWKISKSWTATSAKEPVETMCHKDLQHADETEYPLKEFPAKPDCKIVDETQPVEHTNEEQLAAKEGSSDCASVGDSGLVVSQVSSLVRANFQTDAESDVETMYSAETRESRNYSPREMDAKRSSSNARPTQSSVSCSIKEGWDIKLPRSIPSTQRASQQRRRNQVHPSCTRKISLQVPSYKSSDYFGPTVSSIMKKRNLNAVNNKGNFTQQSPRWIF